MREALRQAVIDAWEEFKVTGAHVTQDEAWLAKLEGGEGVEPPVCHGERQS
jgi:predicted transcriptional regulator